MNLNYKVLWIDDHPMRVQNAKEIVKTKLARKGFDLDVKFLSKVEQSHSLRKHFVDQEYDLLAIDFQMTGDGLQGDQIVKAIRLYCPLTEIVFYSSSPTNELRTIMINKNIMMDGVYYANRNDLHERLNEVIHTTIKKALDLNQMRGIFISCVADFDNIIDELINYAFDRLTDDSKKIGIKNKIREMTKSHHEKSINDVGNITDDDELDSFLSILSSNPKHKVLSQILHEIDDLNLISFCDKISAYEKDVIHPRNQLAHYMKKEFSSGKYTLVNKEKEVFFDDDGFQILRHKLLEYRDIFNELRGKLKPH